MQKAKGSECAPRSLFFLGCIRFRGKAERSEGNPFCAQAFQKAVLDPEGRPSAAKAIPFVHRLFRRLY